MQQAPVRLSQTIWSAFRAAKPVHRPLQYSRHFSPFPQPRARQQWEGSRSRISTQARFYSEKKSEVDWKVEDAKSRIEKTLESRADTVSQAKLSLKNPRDETIVHTIPESSSIVHTSSHGAQTPPKPDPPPPRDGKSQQPPPDSPASSSVAARYSQLQSRFGHFMDNFQTHVFTASRRLNDLTGYSGIEALKTDIENQETLVQKCRQEVKDSRANYTDAVANRSATQREVNDLLHRKHTWSPADLERFTSLYRSDHANEQTETAAQKSVSDAEQHYEEASAKLAKGILARYHEEQIWSDKIRQMSTWGTWGLMGLNVLLFLIFQVVLEPWRRRRLVKGFEEKVELAIRESADEGGKAGAAAVAGAATTTNIQPNQSTSEAVEAMTTSERVEAVADNIAEQIVDAITGTTSDDPETPSSPPTATPFDQPSKSPSPSTRWTSTSSPLASYEDSLRAMFSDDVKLLVSQRDLTAVAMEGVAGGMAIMGLLFVLLRPR